MTESTSCCRHAAILPIVVAIIAGGAYIIGKNIETQREPATISISGEGRVQAVPDIASLSFGVQIGRQQTAQIAMEKLTTNMQAVITAVKNSGIAEKDIKTESLSLYPEYDWKDGQQLPRGFTANQSLRVKVRDMEKVGAVLSAATAAGANQAGGVSFTIDDPEELRAQARKDAIADAQAKAAKLAGDLGLSLGDLRNFNEGGSYQPPMMERAMMDMGVGGGGIAPAAIPLPAGEQEIRIDVTLTYEVR